MYYSMGMLDESLSVYEALLVDDFDRKPEDVRLIDEKTQQLKKEIDALNKDPSAKLSSEEILLIKKTVSSNGSVNEHLDGAAAFLELGLPGEAAAEYEKILVIDRKKSDCFHVDAITGLLQCLMATEPSEAVLKRAKNLIEEQKLSNAECAEIQLRFGKKAEKQNGKKLAIDIFNAAHKADPINPEVKEKNSNTISSRSPESKYDYLLNEKIVSPDQLQKALNISKKWKKSVAKTLIEQFKVKEEEMGKSLSLFYKCPFRSFDPDVVVPLELIKRLKKAFLMHYAWVPLSWGKDGVQVLVDDPNDLMKTDHIKALMPTGKIQFSVGIKEDIIRYIKLFFALTAEKSLEDSLDTLDSIIADILQFICHEKKTGILRARQNATEYQIYFLEGKILYAIQPFKQARLGQLLMRDGITSKEVIDSCLVEAKRKKVAIGKVLVDQGHIAFGTLETYIYKQILEIISVMFRWGTGQFIFQDMQFSLRWLVLVELSTLKLIMEALRINSKIKP